MPIRGLFWCIRDAEPRVTMNVMEQSFVQELYTVLVGTCYQWFYVAWNTVLGMSIQQSKFATKIFFCAPYQQNQPAGWNLCISHICPISACAEMNPKFPQPDVTLCFLFHHMILPSATSKKIWVFFSTCPPPHTPQQGLNNSSCFHVLHSSHT